MRSAILVTLAMLGSGALTGCDSPAEPRTSSMFGYQAGWDHDRTWWLTRESVVVRGKAKERTVVTLPQWLWAGEPLCPPDLALGPTGEAVVTSNVTSRLWRIDPQTLAVTVHDLRLDTDTDRDVGFAAIVYSARQAAFYAYSEVQRSVWRIDRELDRATKVSNVEFARMRPRLPPSVRGPCADLARRLTQFADDAPTLKRLEMQWQPSIAD